MNKDATTLVGIFRLLGFCTLLLSPLVAFLVGMSAEMPASSRAFVIMLAIAWLLMPFATSRIAKNMLKAGNMTTALIVSAIPVTILLIWFSMATFPLIKQK